MDGSAWWLRRRWLRGRDAVADRYVIEPAAPGFAWRPVEAGDVGLEVDDRRPVDEVDAGEPYDGTGHVQQLDEAEPDGVDPPRAPGGEHALLLLLAAQQERNLPERGVVTGPGQLVQPGHQPGVVELGQAVQPAGVAVGDFDNPDLGAIEGRVDRRTLQFGMAGADYPYHRQGDIQVHAAMVSGVSPTNSGRPQRLPSGRTAAVCGRGEQEAAAMADRCKEGRWRGRHPVGS